MLTLGEKIIRPDFSKNDEVRDLKRQFVLLVDKMDSLYKNNYISGEQVGSEEYEKKVEVSRLSSKAVEYLELASMFAVKALTV